MDRKTGRSKNGKGATPIDHLISPSSITKVELDIHHHRKQPTDLAALSLILLLCCWLFSNGLHGEFVFDDSAALANNNDTKSDLTPLPQIFFNDFWGTDVLNKTSHRSYRPTVVLTFRLQHYLMGYRHDVTTLHMVNYIMAYINVCLVYYLARLYMKPHVDSADGVADRPLHVAWRRCAIPFAAALLFLAHPVHVDSVTSIVGRCELMCCFFGLCALFVEHAYLCVWGRGWHVHVGCVLLSTVLMILSVTSKDSGIAYCGVFVVHACAMYLLGRASCIRAIVCTLVGASQAALYVAFRALFLGAVALGSNSRRRAETPQYFVPPGVWHWLAIRWVAAMKNLELLFFPTKLAHEYAYNCVAHLETLSDERLPVFCAVTLVVLCYVCALVYRVLRHHSRGAGMQLVFVLWAVVLYAPVSHFFVTVGTFIAERCLYSSSVGVVLLLAYVFVPAEFPNTRLRWAGCAALCALVLLWLVISHRRNLDWTDPVALYRATVETCPNGGKGWLSYAVSVLNYGGKMSVVNDTTAAWFNRSYELDSELTENLEHLGFYWWLEGDRIRGYNLVRQCAKVCRTAESCVYRVNDMRSSMYPDMKKHEIRLDNVEISCTDVARAINYVHAGRLVFSEEGDVCRAAGYMRKGMHYYSLSNNSWELDPNYDRESDCMCANTMGYLRVLSDCIVKKAKEDDIEEDDVDGFMDDLSTVMDAVRKCHIPWTEPEMWSMERSFEIRLLNFSSSLEIGAKFLTKVLNTSPPAVEDDDSRVAIQRFILELQQRAYCHIALLVKSETLIRRVPPSLRTSMDTLAEQHRALRTSWHRRLVRGVQELRESGASVVWEKDEDILQCAAYILDE